MIAQNFRFLEKTDLATKIFEPQNILQNGNTLFKDNNTPIIYNINLISQSEGLFAYQTHNGNYIDSHIIELTIQQKGKIISQNVNTDAILPDADNSSINILYPNSCYIGDKEYLSLWTDNNGVLYAQVIDLQNSKIQTSDGNTYTKLTIDSNDYNFDSNCAVDTVNDSPVIFILYNKRTSSDDGDIYLKAINKDGTDFSSFPQNPLYINAFSNTGKQIKPKIMIVKHAESNNQIAAFWQHDNYGESWQIYMSIHNYDGSAEIEQKRIYDGYDLQIAQTSEAIMLSLSGSYDNNIYHFGFRKSNLNRPLFPYDTAPGQGQINPEEGVYGESYISIFSDDTYLITYTRIKDGKKKIFAQTYKGYNRKKGDAFLVTDGMSGNYILSQAHILLTDDKRYLISFVDEDSKELYFSIYYFPDLQECPQTCKGCTFDKHIGYVCSTCNPLYDPKKECLECLEGLRPNNVGHCICNQNGYKYENGSCVPCGHRMYGDGEGGCLCNKGLEFGENGQCRPSFEFGQKPGDFDGEGEYGEATSERVQTPPGEVNTQTMFYMGGCILGSLILCFSYVEVKRRIKKGKKKSNIKSFLKSAFVEGQSTSHSGKNQFNLENVSLLKNTLEQLENGDENSKSPFKKNNTAEHYNSKDKIINDVELPRSAVITEDQSMEQRQKFQLNFHKNEEQKPRSDKNINLAEYSSQQKKQSDLQPAQQTDLIYIHQNDNNQNINNQDQQTVASDGIENDNTDNFNQNISNKQTQQQCQEYDEDQDKIQSDSTNVQENMFQKHQYDQQGINLQQQQQDEYQYNDNDDNDVDENIQNRNSVNRNDTTINSSQIGKKSSKYNLSQNNFCLNNDDDENESQDQQQNYDDFEFQQNQQDQETNQQQSNKEIQQQQQQQGIYSPQQSQEQLSQPKQSQKSLESEQKLPQNNHMVDPQQQNQQQQNQVPPHSDFRMDTESNQHIQTTQDKLNNMDMESDQHIIIPSNNLKQNNNQQQQQQEQELDQDQNNYNQQVYPDQQNQMQEEEEYKQQQNQQDTEQNNQNNSDQNQKHKFKLNKRQQQQNNQYDQQENNDFQFQEYGRRGSDFLHNNNTDQDYQQQQNNNNDFEDLLNDDQPNTNTIQNNQQEQQVSLQEQIEQERLQQHQQAVQNLTVQSSESLNKQNVLFMRTEESDSNDNTNRNEIKNNYDNNDYDQDNDF